MKKKKSLKETNPFLRDPKPYEAALVANIITSSAVEGIRVTPSQLKKKSLKSHRS